MKKVINTFLIGAQKAGTTSLYNWLGQHNQIYAPKENKDYHFFSNNLYYKKGVSHINNFYKEAKSQKILLHGGVNYLYFKNYVPERIFAYNKDAKFIVSLRDPVSRAISAYNYFKRKQLEINSFQEAIKKEYLFSDKDYYNQSHFTYIQHGHYYSQLKRYFEVFPISNIKILLFEDIIDIKKRAFIMDDIFSFLEINKNDNIKYHHLNISGKNRYAVISKILNSVKMKDRINYLIPYRKLLKYKIRSKIYKTLVMANTKKELYYEENDMINQEELKILFKKEVLMLTKLLDIDLVGKWNY